MDCDGLMFIDTVISMYEDRMLEACVNNDIKCVFNLDKEEFIAEIDGKFYTVIIRETK